MRWLLALVILSVLVIDLLPGSQIPLINSNGIKQGTITHEPGQRHLISVRFTLNLLPPSQGINSLFLGYSDYQACFFLLTWIYMLA